MSHRTDVSRLAVALALMLLLTSCSRGSLAFDELGESCRGDPGDRASPTYYFADVSRVELLPTESVKTAVEEANRDDFGDLDVSVLMTAPDGVQLHEDGRTASATSLTLFESLIAEASRLPDPDVIIRNVLVAISPSHREGGANVEFIVLVGDGGDIAFAGNCSRRNYKDPLAEYRDAVRPEVPLVDLFLEVVTDESVWADFNDFDLREGEYDR